MRRETSDGSTNPSGAAHVAADLEELEEMSVGGLRAAHAALMQWSNPVTPDAGPPAAPLTPDVIDAVDARLKRHL